MKLKEGKFCVSPDCEEVIPLKENICPSCCGSQFILLASLANPDQRDWVRRRMHREKAKLRILQMVKG